MGEVPPNSEGPLAGEILVKGEGVAPLHYA